MFPLQAKKKKHQKIKTFLFVALSDSRLKFYFFLISFSYNLLKPSCNTQDVSNNSLNLDKFSPLGDVRILMAI